MKAFVTGATGFLGTHIVENLTNEGWELIVLKRDTSDLTAFKNFKNIVTTQRILKDFFDNIA